MRSTLQYGSTFPCDGPGCTNTVQTQRTQWWYERPDGKGKRKHYCCNACRQRAYRFRHSTGCRHLSRPRSNMKTTVTSIAR